MPNSPILIGLFAVIFLVCAFALGKGGAAERFGAVAILANIILAFVGDALVPPAYGSLLQLTLDGVTALAFLILALSYASLWLGVVMLLYAIQFGLHGYYQLAQRPKDSIHVVINNVDFVLVSVCLAVGALVAWRRRNAAAGG
jgi:hypothetical protein